MMSIIKKAAFCTLGCKVNQYETEAMRRLLRESGYDTDDAAATDHTDVIVINSCTVTGESDRKLRQLLRRCRRDNPNAVVAVCGCYPQHAAAALEHMDIDVIGGSANRAEFLQQVITAAETKGKATVLD